MSGPYAEGTAFKYVCGDCGLPFAQSYDFHKREYHDGEPFPTRPYRSSGGGES